MTRTAPCTTAPEPAARCAAHRRRQARPMHQGGPSPTQDRFMRTALLAVVTILLPTRAVAQDTAIVINAESSAAATTPTQLPRPVAEQAIRLFNAASTTRLVGRTRLPPGNAWRGDVALRNGSVALGGRIEGTLLVINGDATLDSSAAVTGDVIVIGGTVVRAPGAEVGGEVRVYREPLPYRTDGDLIALAPNPRRRLPFLGARRTWATPETRSSLTVATAGTFNRVEGLPIVFGPEFSWRVKGTASLRLDALGLARSVGNVGTDPGNLGYVVRTELRSGDERGAGLGFRAYSIVAPIEAWSLHSAEVGWAAFLFQRDYRDYYFARGVSGRVFVQPRRPLTVALEVARDWQTSVAARDPWTVFRNSGTWRANPPIDDGHYTTLGGVVTFDTRNDRDQPTAGWLLQAALDNSWSDDVSPQVLPVGVRRPIPTDGSYQFRRLFVDLRRYTRVSPSGRVNLRVLTGGWLGGDALPLQQRLSLGGADPLSGYGFRHTGCNGDLTDPVFTRSHVAACDRVLLTQIEYRGHLSLHWSYDASRPKDEAARALLTLQGPDLVVFGDAGQAWLVGDGPGRLPSDRLPTLGSWLADLGMGMDWGGFGVYVAKAVTAGEPLRLTVRLDHRF